ncbi:MAG: EAL domain-containing protein, partial [Syntrophaceae bacterium]|nr:EAL domain-containing protein [Syntrophaceae bacterium]
ATLSLLLSEADRALRLAQQAAPNSWHLIAMTDEVEKMPAGQQQWKTALEKVIHDRRINLVVQSVTKTVDLNALLHLEILTKIIWPEEGLMFNADRFLPYAERLGLTPLLDRLVLEEVLKLDRRQLAIDHVAVNISPASLSDSAFMEWIYKTLKNVSSSAPRITFEFSEFAAIRNLPLLREFQAVVQECGHDIAVDHFGQGLSNFAYLHSLHPGYVKINRAYTGEIKDAESDMRFFVASLCNIAHSVDVAVIAVGVETELQYELLRDINIDGVQGFFIDTPKPISSYLKEL